MNDYENIELLWVQFSETAASEFHIGRFYEAMKQWQNAYRVAQNFEDRDPRVASSLSNLAIAFRIHEDFEKAERYYRRALKNWEKAAQWVDEMHLEGRAHSAVVHFLKEQKYREQYDRLALREYQKIYPAGYAGTLNNLAELFHTTNQLNDAKLLYKKALRKRIHSMGENESGVIAIRNNIGMLSNIETHIPDSRFSNSQKSNSSPSFSSLASRHRWVIDQPPEFTDKGRLMAAILLTDLLEHSRFCIAH